MSRAYKIGEEKMVSVTTVIGDYDTGGLMQWAANEAVEYIRERYEIDVLGVEDEDWDKARYAYKEKSKEATDIGTEVHDYCETYIKFRLGEKDTYVTVTDRIAQAVGAFHKWEEENKPEFIAPELTVHSDIHKYAGTLDLVCKLDDKLYIIDFKTSKKHYPKNAVQLAAYKHAYEEMTGLTVDGVAVLRLDKVTGEYDWKDYTKVVDRQWLSFLGLLQTWNNYKKRRL